MKRCWLGAGLLLLLLVLGLFSAGFLSRFGGDLGRQAEQAAALADSDRDAAAEILAQVRGCWQRKRFWLTILMDQEPIREADTLFALLESPLEADTFRENALRLSRLLAELGAAQLPKPENIL